MLAQGRPPLGRGLFHPAGADRALIVGVERQPQRVDARGLQPLGGPLRQVPAGGLLQRAQQVGQGGVAVRVLGEVGLHPAEEGLAADVGDQLDQHRRALGVGDLVEVVLDRLEIDDVGRDRMGRRKLILPVGQGLGAAAERGPGLRRVLGPLADGEVGGPGRERLLEPQVVPPRHGDQIAEPHVRQLVQDRVPAVVERRGGHLAAEQVLIAQRDAADVLHRAAVVLRDEDLVVLPKRIREIEVPLEDLEAVGGDREDLLGVQKTDHRLAAQDRHRVGLDPDRRAVHLVVLPGHQSGQIRRDGQRFAESRQLQVVAALLLIGDQRVGDHGPRRRGEHRDGESGLEVGLFETGVHPPGVRHLELGVEIPAPVHRVDEPVQSLPAAAVATDGLHGQRVRALGQDQREPGCLERGRIKINSVELGRADLVGDQVQVGGPVGPGPERQRRGGDELAVGVSHGPTGEVDLDRVRLGLDQRGPLLRLGPQQVVGEHGVDPATAFLIGLGHG